MNRSIFIRVAAPAVVVGLLLLATCLAGAHYIQRLQADLAGIVSRDVASLQAAEELEISVRQLRFHDSIYLMDPNPRRAELIAGDQAEFHRAFADAKAAGRTAEEQDCLRQIEEGYRQYEEKQARARASATGNLPRAELARLIDSQSVRTLIDEPCK